MKKNREIKNVKIEKIGYGGIGVGVLENGKKVLIRGGVLPNSVVNCRVTRKKKDFVEARVTEVVSYDKEWADAKPLCPHYANPTKQPDRDNEHVVGCGGCKWQLMSYAKQLIIKQDFIIDSFRSAKSILDRIGIKPILPAPQEYQYRNKIEFSFGKYIKGKLRNAEEVEDDDVPMFLNHQWQLGFHKHGEFSKVIDVDQCFLVSEKMHEVFAYMKNICKESRLPVHDQKVHTGFFRHLAMREGTNTGHIMVNLVVADEQLLTKESKQRWEDLKKAMKKDKFLKENVHSFVLTYNNGLADIVKGRDSHSENLFGDGTIYENLTLTADKSADPVDVSFRIGPFSFFQTNTHGAELLFSTAAELVGKVSGTILDLYCGAGTIGLSFLEMGKGDFTAGIDIVEESIVNANENAAINGRSDKSYFAAGKAEDLIFSDKVIAKKLEDLGLVIVDPPRSGLHKDVVKFLNELRVNHSCKLLYISCNPVTLARDLAMLEEGGWKTTILQPVDMFPHTHHVENISVLS